MRAYQLVVVLSPDLKDEQRKKFLGIIKEWLGSVKVVKEDAWGQKALAYPIKKERLGFYESFNLESDEAIPADFEKRLLTNDNVLRHLLIRTK